MKRWSTSFHAPFPHFFSSSRDQLDGQLVLGSIYLCIAWCTVTITTFAIAIPCTVGLWRGCEVKGM